MSMGESSRRPRWWLIGTAAVLAVLTLYYYTGSWIVVALFFGAFGAIVVYQTRGTKRVSVHACMRCGAKLNPNARQCDSCGSASWTVRH
jgi:ribosomal protein L40E